MAQPATQFDWESARAVDDPPQPAAAPAPAPEEDSYPGAPLADPQSQTTGSTVPMFDWDSARAVGEQPAFDWESARSLSELADDPSYLMSREQRRAYKAEAQEEDSVVADFLAGIPTIIPGIAGISVGTLGEAGQQIGQNWYRPDKLLAAFTANVNESQRINSLNYAKLFDYVYRNVRDYSISVERDRASMKIVADRLREQGALTGDPMQDDRTIAAAFKEAKARGEFPASEQEQAEDEERDYQDYVRRWSFDNALANATDISVAGMPATLPSAQFGGRNIVTGEYVPPGQFSPQALAIGTDPGNILAFGAGSITKVAALRRAGILLGKGLGPVGQGLSTGGAFLTRQADRISNRVQLATGGQMGASGKIVGGLTPEMQTYGGGLAAGGLAYITGGDSVLDNAMTGALALVPSLRGAGGILKSAGATANAGWIISREAGAGGMSVRQAEAAAKLGANAVIPKRYSRFMTGEARTAADSTLRRVAQDEANPRLLRSLAQFGDNVGVTSVFRATDDAVGGALGGAAVSTPFALAMERPEEGGAVIGGGLLFGAAGGMIGGKLTRMAEMQDANVARMLVDAEANGGNAAAFATMPHSDLVGMAGLQAFSRGKLKFVPLTTSEYRVNLDVQRQGGENTAGFYVEQAMDGAAKVFINMGEPSKVAGTVAKVRTRKDGTKVIEVRGEDGQSTFTYVPNASRVLVKQGDVVGVGTPLTRSTPARLSVPEEIAHAIFSGNAMNGLPRDEMRNYVNQRYKTDGISARGREYVATTVDSEIAAGMHGAADAVDEAMRERLIQERFEEYSRGSIEKGDDPLDWARDEVIAASLRAATQGIDLNRLRNQSNFSRLAEQVVASSAQALRLLGVDVDRMGRVVDPAATFRDNPVFADPAMRRMVTKYMRDYDQWLAGMEDAGRKDRRGVRVAPSGKAEDMANSQHTVLREVKDANGNGTGVFENDVLVRGTDGKVRTKEQVDIDKTEISRAAQIKSLYDAGRKVPTASTEFGRRVVNGRETVGGPTLPPQWDLFTQFPQWIREFARQLENGRANGKTWIADYNAIGTGSSGRYRVTNLGNIEAILREVAFVGWQVTKKNHLLATVFDMNAFRASAKRAIDNGELGEFGNNMDEVNATLLQYLDNHKNGRPGETVIGQTKKNILNGLIGTGTAKQSAANPFYADLNPRGSLRTFRVDRLNDLRDTGRTGYNFIYEAINANMMPDNNNRMPQQIPREAQGMPDAPRRVKMTKAAILNTETGKIYTGPSHPQIYDALPRDAFVGVPDDADASFFMGDGWNSPEGLVDGFVDADGKFYDREDAARAVGSNEPLESVTGLQQQGAMEPQARPRGQAMPDAQPAEVRQDGTVVAPEDAPTFTLPRRAMAQFMPDTGINLEDYADRPIVALPADRMGIGQMRVGPKGAEQILSVPGQGGAGFMEIYNGGGWAFTDTATADRFLGRLREVARPGDTSVIVGITALNEVNHLKNQTGQLAYVEALEAAIKNKSISRKQADAHIREIAKRIYTSKAQPKDLAQSTRDKFKAMRSFDDFQKAVRAKSLNFADAAWLLDKMQQRTLPVPYKEARDIGIAFDDVARQTADPRYADVPFGTVVALLEVPINQAPSKNPFHYAYPAKVEGNRIGFLSKFQNIDDLTSDPRIRNKQGRVTAQPLQTVLPVMDRVGQPARRGQAMPDTAIVPAGESAISTYAPGDRLPANTALVNLVNNDGQVTALVGMPYDGTEQGLIRAHAQLDDEISKRYEWRRQYTKSMSQRGGTDAEGNPAYVVSANLKTVAAVGTPQARYILGDLSADPGDAPALPKPKRPSTAGQDPAGMALDDINRELDDFMMSEKRLTAKQQSRQKALLAEVEKRAGKGMTRLPPMPEFYGPRKELKR